MPSDIQSWRIGADTGGTFTDLVLIDADGVIRDVHKLLSTPEDPSRAVLVGIAQLLAGQASGRLGSAKPQVVHGSTVATNALLERNGAKAALITTSGFEDVLTIARQNRPELYALVPNRPEPAIHRSMTVGAPERVLADGSKHTPLCPTATAAVVDQLKNLDPESIAICLLHSYVNPDHELQIAQAIRTSLPNAHLTISHKLLPEMREYERTATCAANAVVGPVMSRYLARLEASLGAGRLRIMGSGGGTLPVSVVSARPVETVVSGPAGGAIGAWEMARSAGIDRAIGFDMGGTSTDLSLMDGGPMRTTHTSITGLPIRLPMIDIHTVGAGGGSIAEIDIGGAIRVGPQSAGSVPGPACYGRQKLDEPLATVTDAHVVLGHLTDKRSLGDSLSIQRDAARRTVGILAEQAALTIEQAAHGILRIADAAMSRAIKAISIQRGHDLRNFTLLAFGGAGGLHACRLAEILGISRVLIPRNGGLLSAIGMLAAPPCYHFSQAAISTLIPDGSGQYPNLLAQDQVREALFSLRGMGQKALSADGVDVSDQCVVCRVDLRYAGQSHEISVEWDEDVAVEHFITEHNRLYGYTLPGRAIEAVTLRVEASGPAPRIQPGALPWDDRGGHPQERWVPVAEAGGVCQWACLQRTALKPGVVLRGPLLIEEYAATTIIPRGWDLEVLADGQLSATQ